jgi:transketolase
MRTKRAPIDTFGEALLEVGTQNPSVVAISADSSSGSGLSPFKNKFPERHLEFGIMEQGVFGYAAGLATTGKIPFIAAIAPFVTARPFEMFRNDLGYMKQNVKVVGRCAGLSYSHLGATHQSLDDVAIVRTIPGVVVLSPGDPVEIEKAVKSATDHVGPVYMRIGSPEMPVLHSENIRFEIGKGLKLMDGNEVTLIGTGTVLHRVCEAAELLAKDSISVRTLSIHTIKPLDRDLILQAARETGRIVTVEEHYLIGGLGSAVAELLVKECPVPMLMIGVDDKFASNGPYDDLLGLYGLLGPQIAGAVRDFLRTRTPNGH